MMATDTMYALGFALRKRQYLRACIKTERLVFVDSVKRVPAGAQLLVWGLPRLSTLAPGVRVIHVEDGFLRSVGLGADWIRPMSWVVDGRGMYFDATRESDLESILATVDWSPELLQRACALRERIVQLGLTKYNVGTGSWSRPKECRTVVLVPGQVETDASIRWGSPVVRGNLALLQRVRAACPDAYIVYKPHPDVVAGLRLRGLQESKVVEYCDELVLHAPMHQLLEQVDEVHVMTSLAGFEALLRGRKVVCYGQPFYAGWGLTTDVHPPERRRRLLSLDALVAGALILYPRYFSQTGSADSTPERALDDLDAWRSSAAAQMPAWRRAWRPVLQALAWWQDGKRRKGT